MQAVTRKVRVLAVSYNASNNELVSLSHAKAHKQALVSGIVHSAADCLVLTAGNCVHARHFSWQQAHDRCSDLYMLTPAYPHVSSAQTTTVNRVE